MNDKWFKKQVVPTSVLLSIGVDELSWAAIAEKVHIDDINSVVAFLGIDEETLMSILYSSCDDPLGIIVNKKLN